jgi:hypothetical protein
LRQLFENDHRRKAPKHAVGQLIGTAIERPANKKTQIQKYYIAEHHKEYIAALHNYQRSEEGQNKHSLTQQHDTLKHIWAEKGDAWVEELTKQRDAIHEAKWGDYKEKQVAFLTGAPKNRDWGL